MTIILDDESFRATAANVTILVPDFEIDSTILASLLDTVGLVDHELLAHASRVVRLVSLTVDRLPAINESDRLLAQATALLHDVGKAGISPAILLKPGSLTSTEMSIVRCHAAIGANLVATILEDDTLAAAIRHHHEWWNGDGYPDQLSGRRIPFASRVVGIADAFDAMTTDRPYRSAMLATVALEKIRRGVGTQFEPEAAQAFITAIETG